MPTYTPIQSIELTAATSSVTFGGIPQTYQDLVLVCRIKGNSDPTTSLRARFNGDTGSNYSVTSMYGRTDGVGSERYSNVTSGYVNNSTWMPFAANTFGVGVLHFLNYSNSSIFKTILTRFNSNSGTNYFGTEADVLLWRNNTSGINSMQLYFADSIFDVGCTFDLYGISPVAADTAQAFGGTEVFYDSTYVYHVFKGSGTFTPYRNLTCDYLVVAGGGGGGNYTTGGVGGGGGAGGLRAFTGASLTANTSYTVTVGAGGDRGTTGGGSNGTASTFNSNSVSGGGGGGCNGREAGNSGGSGGGGQGGGGTAGSGNAGGYSPVEGYAGGTGGNGSPYGGGGGGGAAAAGQNSSAVSNNGGAGGAGTDTYNSINFSTWLTATGTGSSSKLAGGGGGGSLSNPGSGGAGGGGTAGAASPQGLTNTGGGGAGNHNGTANSAGNGGSGLVILRYAR